MRFWALLLLSAIIAPAFADDACVLAGYHRPAGLTFTRYICWSVFQDFIYLNGSSSPTTATFSWDLIQEDSPERERYHAWLATLDCPCRSKGSRVPPRFSNPLLARLQKPKPEPIIEQAEAPKPVQQVVIETPPLEKVKPTEHFSMNLSFQSMSSAFENESAALAMIRRLEDYLNRNSKLSITLMGVIDNKGPPCSWTRGLARKRAQAVERVLVRDGLSTSRILKTTGARAGTHLATPKSTCFDEHPENRRIIVRFFDEDGKELNVSGQSASQDLDQD